MKTLQQYRQKVDQLKSEKKRAKERCKEETLAVRGALQSLCDTEEAQKLIQAVAQKCQQNVHSHIASVVTRCLAAVFGKNAYEFDLSFVQKRGRTEAVLSLVRDGVSYSPLDSTGGGVVDVVGFALRCACIILHRPPLRRLIIADEPFRFVSREYRSNIATMIETMSNDLGIQFVLVTHSEELEIGKVIRV